MANIRAGEPARLDESIAGFLHYLTAECNVSDHTIAAYRGDLVHFCRWRDLAGLAGEATISVERLGQYVDYLVSLALAPSSIARHVASLSTYFRYLILDGRMKDNLAKLLSALPSGSAAVGAFSGGGGSVVVGARSASAVGSAGSRGARDALCDRMPGLGIGGAPACRSRFGDRPGKVHGQGG